MYNVLEYKRFRSLKYIDDLRHQAKEKIWGPPTTVPAALPADKDGAGDVRDDESCIATNKTTFACI